MTFRYSLILAFMGQLKDRFSVYQQERALEEKVALAAKVEGVGGVEMVYPNEIPDTGLVKELLARYGLRLSAVNVNLKGDPRWHQGALTARDEGTRAEAVRWLQNGMDLAAETGSDLVTVCPLADGHDYPFETNYSMAWRSFVQGVRAAADHRPDVRLSLEYKKSEPRARVILDNVGKVLHACAQIDRPNVGVTLDMGHALYAGESCAESAALLADAGKLFLVHGNDNYRDWDWDLIPGYVNLWDLIESTYYLRNAKYDGWISFDVFPSRLDPVRAMRACLRMYRFAETTVERIGRDRLDQTIEDGDVLETLALLQSHLEEKALQKADR